LRTLRQDQRDLVASRNALRGERIRQAIRLLLEVPERERAARAGLVLPIEREARAIVRPPAATGVGDGELRRHIPPVRAMDLCVAGGGHRRGGLSAGPRLRARTARRRSRPTRAAARAAGRAAPLASPAASGR